MRASVYIDGFNFYYGAVKGTSYKWLDLGALCRLLLPGDTIGRIRYFTARITARPGEPDQPTRQDTYLQALATVPNLTIHYGHYLSRATRMPLAHPPAGGPRTVEVIRTEEKGSDVNLATYLLCDAFDGDFEVAVIISNDSDLKTPIEVVRAKFGLTVGVLNPQKNPSHALRKAASFYRPVRIGPIQASQFPNPVLDRHGQAIFKPARW